VLGLARQQRYGAAVFPAADQRTGVGGPPVAFERDAPPANARVAQRALYFLVERAGPCGTVRSARQRIVCSTGEPRSIDLDPRSLSDLTDRPLDRILAARFV